MNADYHDEEFTDYERNILDNIESHGCFIPFVLDPDGEQPDFAYSVGFPHTVEQGEVIIFGLPQEVAHFAINDTLRQCREDGLVLRDMARISGLLEGFSVIARAVHPAWIEREYLNSAMWHHVGRYGTPLTEVYQLVWPSALTGLFPWEPGCATDVIALQPALYETSIH